MSGAHHQLLQQRAGDAVPLDARRAWLLLRDRGGYWYPSEVGNALAPRVKERTVMAGAWLRALEERGHVAFVKNDAGTRRYGVTGRCLPIPGESLEPQGETS